MHLELEKTNPHIAIAIAMGRKEKQETGTGTGTSTRRLSVKIPSFFRCPISLDVMKSPVSLCTGVTYDRSSIQRWLDSGNNTCPATMQPLPSTDLTPNLTLHRLIKLWLPSRVILQDILSSADPVPAINDLFDILCDEDDDGTADDDKSTLVGGVAVLLAAKLADPTTTLCAAEPVVALVFKILATFPAREEPCRKAMLSALASGALDGTVSSLLLVMKDGTSPDSRRNAAAVLDAVIGNVPPSDGESKVAMAEKPGLLPELVRLASRDDGAAVEAALSCLVGLSEVRRARLRMVRLGIVPLSARILGGREAGPGAAEKALKLLEVAAGCSEGREEICELGERCIGAIVGRIMKVGKEGTESAVAVLWSVCHLFRDRRAQEAVAASGGGGLTKMLLLMQSDCSAAVRRMAGDLLRIFRVNSKSCLSGYDTKTTHIMPF